MRTRIWHSDWKPRWLIRCVSAARVEAWGWRSRDADFAAYLRFRRDGSASRCCSAPNLDPAGSSYLNNLPCRSGSNPRADQHPKPAPVLADGRQMVGARPACMVPSPPCRVPGDGGDALSRTSTRRPANGQARPLGGARASGETTATDCRYGRRRLGGGKRRAGAETTYGSEGGSYDTGRLFRDSDPTEEGTDDQDESPCLGRRRGALVRWHHRIRQPARRNLHSSSRRRQRGR